MTKRETVDLARVRAARADLQGLAREHPELTSDGARYRLAAWLAEEETQNMGEDKEPVPMSIRLDKGTAARLDTVAKRHSPPGLALTRTDAMRMALNVGLEILESKDPVTTSARAEIARPQPPALRSGSRGKPRRTTTRRKPGSKR